MASRTRKLTKPSAALVAAVLMLAGGAPTALHAAPAANTAGAPLPCGVLEDLGGQVQLLDATRSHTIDALKGAALACGSWISTPTDGAWAALRHRDGFVVRLGAGSFAQIAEPNPDGKFTGDTFTLYKGTLQGRAGGGTGELKVMTANARARVSRGSVIVVYDAAAEETQLVALANFATLENRFESNRRVRVGAGEASALNFRQLRVVPTAAKAVSVASLRAQLRDLHLGERAYEAAVAAASRRASRTFASKLEADEAEGISTASAELSGHASRAPAGLVFATPGTPDAKGRPRFPAVDAEAEKEMQDNLVREQLARKLAAGEASADRMVFPARFSGKAHRVKLEVVDPVDPAAGVRQQSTEAERKEKRRLIDELSQIRLE